MEKIYYQCCFTQKAPLRISNGDGENTDSDLMRDSRGLPFIPGTSIAGVLRSMLEENEANDLFGKISGKVVVESKVLVSDAVLSPECTINQISIFRRDGIGINDYGTTVFGSKYDFETAMTDQEYTAVLEWTGESQDNSLTILERLMQHIAVQGISFGARTSRGYGHMDAVVRTKKFSFPNDLKKWLNFDAMKKSSFDGCSSLIGRKAEKSGVIIQAKLQMKGNFSVRKYTTRVIDSMERNAPDYSPLMGNRGPIIPGTSWSGAIRHHMRDMVVTLGCDEDVLARVDAVFGKMASGADSKKSQITFYETEIIGGQNVTVTRNAIDRYTQSPRNRALFTSEVHRGGTGTLGIRISDTMSDKLFLQLLAATLYDLDLGLLTVGGEAGVGHGRAEITEICVNGTDVTQKLKNGETTFLIQKEGQA